MPMPKEASKAAPVVEASHVAGRAGRDVPEVASRGARLFDKRIFMLAVL
jgi:hypothetical protein